MEWCGWGDTTCALIKCKLYIGVKYVYLRRCQRMHMNTHGPQGDRTQSTSLALVQVCYPMNAHGCSQTLMDALKNENTWSILERCNPFEAQGYSWTRTQREFTQKSLVFIRIIQMLESVRA